MKFLFSVLALCLTFVSFAQTGRIKGIIRDEKGVVLSGAAVIYRKDVTIGALSDEQGKYELEVPSGNCRLICRFTGMVTDTLTVQIIPNQTVTVDITLEFFIKEIKQVEIKVGKFDKPIEEQTVTMVVIKPELIENKITRSIETALDQTPGLNILDGEPQIRGGSGFTFGVGSKVAIIVDDIPI
jgi:iron complex outermembrane receptor protein